MSVTYHTDIKRLLNILKATGKQYDVEKIKKAFKKDIIHQVYQCTEGFLGYTCEYGSMHFNEDIQLDKSEEEKLEKAVQSSHPPRSSCCMPFLWSAC